MTSVPFVASLLFDFVANLGFILAGIGGILAVRQHRQRPAAGAFIAPLLPVGLWLCIAGSVMQLAAWAVVSVASMQMPLLARGWAPQLVHTAATCVVWSMLLWAVGVAMSGHGLIMTVRKALQSRRHRRRPA